MKQQKTIRLLALSCILLLCMLAAIAVHEHYFTRIYKRIFPPTLTKPQPTDNTIYNEQLLFYQLYQQPFPHDIVMIGTSLTMKIQWEELIGRQGIINRGVGNDITEGIRKRIEHVVSIHPKICFIEGGSNDIDFAIPTSEIISNLEASANMLQQANIIPVLFAMPMVSNVYPNFMTVNHKIETINNALRHFAVVHKIQIIDLNPQIGNGKMTFPQFVAKDGMHLAPKTYIIWAAEIRRVLALYNL